MLALISLGQRVVAQSFQDLLAECAIAAVFASVCSGWSNAGIMQILDCPFRVDELSLSIAASLFRTLCSCIVEKFALLEFEVRGEVWREFEGGKLANHTPVRRLGIARDVRSSTILKIVRRSRKRARETIKGPNF